jgi:glucose/arabinose dehydrogenase
LTLLIFFRSFPPLVGAFDGRTADQIYGCRVHPRLSRIQYNTNTGTVTGTEEIIIDGETKVGNSYLGCGQFATHGATYVIEMDGFIYLATGDGASFQAPDIGEFPNVCLDPPDYLGAFRSLNPASISGKIIKVNPNDLTWEIFTGGHRNPFRLTVVNTPNGNQLWESETGWYTWEEINHLEAGKTYGWYVKRKFVLKIFY